MIAKVLNMLIGLKGDNYYSKVLKTIIIRSKKITLFGSNLFAISKSGMQGGEAKRNLP